VISAEKEAAVLSALKELAELVAQLTSETEDAPDKNGTTLVLDRAAKKLAAVSGGSRLHFVASQYQFRTRPIISAAAAAVSRGLRELVAGNPPERVSHAVLHTLAGVDPDCGVITIRCDDD
jgi:hypothetical protein